MEEMRSRRLASWTLLIISQLQDSCVSRVSRRIIDSIKSIGNLTLLNHHNNTLLLLLLQQERLALTTSMNEKNRKLEKQLFSVTKTTMMVIKRIISI